MNILIVAEKPSITRHLAPFAREHWSGSDITFAHAVPYGNFGFSYPRGLSFQEFPVISEPRYRLNAWAEWRCQPQRMQVDGSLAPTEMSEALFKTADLIVFACDPDHGGAISFEVLMHQVFGDDRAADCPSLYLGAVDDASMRKALGDMTPFGERFANSLSYGRMKRYFDWNWNLNGLAILGNTMSRIGMPPNDPPLSKYALQLLYALRDAGPMSQGEIVKIMFRWKGTGRYQGTSGAFLPSLGSEASRTAIIENLMRAGLLEQSTVEDKNLLHISTAANHLLAALHPDCKDLDLPFRLREWFEQGASARPAIDRYIRTFFGKQKRFLGRS